MNLYLLKQSCSWEQGYKIVAIRTTLEKAIEMMREWYNEEDEDRCRFEACESTLTIDGKWSTAQIASKESRAWIFCEIEEGWTNNWLN